MGKFNQSLLSDQITFQKVIDCYKSAPIGISEVFVPEKGWFKPTLTTATEDDVWQLAMSGVTHFNFEVIDEFGKVCYPDFSLNELVNYH